MTDCSHRGDMEENWPIWRSFRQNAQLPDFSKTCVDASFVKTTKNLVEKMQPDGLQIIHCQLLFEENCAVVEVFKAHF